MLQCHKSVIVIGSNPDRTNQNKSTFGTAHSHRRTSNLRDGSAAANPLAWASRSLQREFEEVIIVEVLIEEMSRSDWFMNTYSHVY